MWLHCPLLLPSVLMQSFAQCAGSSAIGFHFVRAMSSCLSPRRGRFSEGFLLGFRERFFTSLELCRLAYHQEGGDFRKDFFWDFGKDFSLRWSYVVLLITKKGEIFGRISSGAAECILGDRFHVTECGFTAPFCRNSPRS